MPQLDFWNAGEQVWGDYDKVREAWSEKITANTILDEVNFDEFLQDPLKTVTDLFARKSVPVDIWEKQTLNRLHHNLMEQKLTGSCEGKIPSLNDPDIVQVRNGQVVSFRCMIQNIMDQDFWPHQITVRDPVSGEKVTKPTLLQDITKDIEDELPTGYGELVEKEVFVAISPPGECAWVTRMDSKLSRGLAGECKRTKLDNDEEGVISLPNYKDVVPILFQNTGDGKPMACLVKILRDFNEQYVNVKPNDLVEVTGVVHFPEFTTQEEDQMKELLPSGLFKLPTLHVFSCITLANGVPQLPIIDGKMFPLLKTADILVSKCAQTLRELLALSLGGDRYGAAYVMTALVARVLQREGSVNGPIGKFMLNLSGVPTKSEIPNELQYALKALVPRILALDVTIQNLNTWKLTPTKYDPSLLEPGLLQIAHGTQVILDETNLQEGALDDRGIRNVQVLGELIQEQHVKYDYTYQFPAIPTHVPVIIISTGPAITPNDTEIKLKLDAKLSLEEKRKRIEELLAENCEQLRAYLSIASSISLSSYDLLEDESLQDELEAFFSARNQPTGFNKKMSAAEFSAFITSCRLWCLLHGHLSITRDGFNFWKELDLIRDSRFQPSKN